MTETSRYLRYEFGRRRVVMRTKRVPLAAVAQADKPAFRGGGCLGLAVHVIEAFSSYFIDDSEELWVGCCLTMLS